MVHDLRYSAGNLPVLLSRNPKKGLFTHGREFYRLGDDCPDELQDWNHVQLNKDDPNPDEYAGDLGKYSGFHIKAEIVGSITNCS